MIAYLKKQYQPRKNTWPDLALLGKRIACHKLVRSTADNYHGGFKYVEVVPHSLHRRQLGQVQRNEAA